MRPAWVAPNARRTASSCLRCSTEFATVTAGKRPAIARAAAVRWRRRWLGSRESAPTGRRSPLAQRRERVDRPGRQFCVNGIVGLYRPPQAPARTLGLSLRHGARCHLPLRRPPVRVFARSHLAGPLRARFASPTGRLHAAAPTGLATIRLGDVSAGMPVFECACRCGCPWQRSVPIRASDERGSEIRERSPCESGLLGCDFSRRTVVDEQMGWDA